MTSRYQANKLAYKILGEYNTKMFDTEARLIELVKEETSDKDDQTNLYDLTKQAMKRISSGGLS